ncbi:MAG: LysM peptidoglycan-binding domain-containing protein [Longimicrobiales bacterium]
MSKDNETPAVNVDPNVLKSNEVARNVLGTGVKPTDFRVDFRDGVATLSGSVQSEDDRNRVLAAARGVSGVTSITDSMKIGGAPAASSGSTPGGSRSYTVKSGDTLSKIAKAHYGDASEYNKIFDANRNILSDADEIQPGQVLVIP